MPSERVFVALPCEFVENDTDWILTIEYMPAVLDQLEGSVLFNATVLGF